MKTITLVANNRLRYLKATVDCLMRNNLSGYELFIGVEPGDKAVIDFCQHLDFMPTHVMVNSERLGVRWNPYHTICRAFDAGSQFNVAFEDDLLISPDALDLANFYFQLSLEDLFCVCLFRHKGEPSQPECLEYSRHFSPLGWGVTRERWLHIFKLAWGCDPQGWDFSINHALSKYPNMKIVQPKLSRTNHVGREGGTHCPPEIHDQYFSDVSTSDGSIRLYQLI